MERFPKRKLPIFEKFQQFLIQELNKSNLKVQKIFTEPPHSTKRTHGLLYLYEFNFDHFKCAR